MGNIFDRKSERLMFAGNFSDPSVYILFEYCGAWYYRKKCLEVIKLLEEKCGRIVQFHLAKDKGITGRFDITLYKTI